MIIEIFLLECGCIALEFVEGNNERFMTQSWLKLVLKMLFDLQFCHDKNKA